MKAEWINECIADFQARTTTKGKHIKIECQAGILGISRNVISYRMLNRYLLGLINKRVLHASLFYFSMDCKHPLDQLHHRHFLLLEKKS